MRRTQAKDQPAAAPPPVPRLVAPSGSALRRRRAGRAAAGAGRGAETADGIMVPGGPEAVDANVPAAIGHALEQVLADRLTRAGLLDADFAGELAERVARFTREGGKLTRPQLLWWSMRACGGGDESTAAAALRIGAALELLQTCALVHDDVMDGSALRRGRPALHADVRDGYCGAAAPARAARFGEAAAVLAGDLALAWADDVVADTALDPWTATVVREVWSDMRIEMVAGQFLDLQGQLTGSRSPSRALRAAHLKSALYSVQRPLALGAAVAGADGRTMRALCSAGRCVGMAFQLRDDLEDVFGDPRHTGKNCGGDIRGGKPTYLAALAVARAKARADRPALAVLERALGNEELTRAGLDEVREVLVRTGARAAVEAKIERLSAQGLRHFDGASLHADAAGRLRGLLSAQAAGRPADPPPARSHPASAAAPAGSDAPEGRR
ncbi:polyprenyl synthetase family protein [Streptomyces erythrochromogenes]|uniref:polyprenyl synthetase family protein n=1 Tax=Streptomyces erythrochromogenes TaxID=285574 RepID=UPI00099DCA33|nr:polyprenyl synthetase family protein [Streptomyces erythrochromogenes]